MPAKLKRIDFAAVQPTIDRLRAVEAERRSHEEDDDGEEDEDERDVLSGGSDNDVDDEDGHGRASIASISKRSGLSSLVQHAAAHSSSRPPASYAYSNAAPSAKISRWLTQRNNQAPNGGPGGYQADEDSDPDRHYFNRGLGSIDDIDSGNASAEDEDEYELSRNEAATKDGRTLPYPQHNEEGPGNIIRVSVGQDNPTSAAVAVRGPGGDGSDGEDGAEGQGFGGMGAAAAARAARPHRPPMASYDVRSYRVTRTNNADSEHTPPEGTTTAGGETTGSDWDSEEDNPEAEARYEWQHMLSNVLQGEVLKSEKTRISGTLTNDLDDQQNNRKWRAYQIWLRVRAYVRGRSVQQETDYLEEARGNIEAIWGEVAKFQVVEDEALLEAERAEEADGTRYTPDAAEQIAMMIRKIEWCDGLYPSIKSLRTEKAHAAEKHVMDRIDALTSWQSITKRLKTQIGILQRWTGSEELEVTQPGQEAIDEEADAGPASSSPNSDSAKKPVHHLLDTSPFIERIFKEDTLQKTFEKATIMDLYRLVHDAKSVMINCRGQFTDMNLPTFYNDLIALVNFPTNLIQEALKIRLNYAQNVASEQPSQVYVDQLTGDFRSGLALAAKMKENFIEIMTPNVAKGWPGGSLSEEYDKVLLDSLRFFFKLLNWKLKSGSKAIYLKETEIVENEWKFLSEAVEQIDGGDLLVGEHFCQLTHRLLMRVTNYFEEQLQVLGERDMSASEMSRWFNQTLDNVRLRHRKLLRFGKAMQQRFEIAAEYLLDDVNLNTFVHALAETEHFLVYTGTLESQAIYIIATSTLIERQSLLRQMLCKCLGFAGGLDFIDGEMVGEEPHYLLVLSPHEPFIWTGAILNLEDLPHFDFDMREGRVRLVADGPGNRLAAAKQIFHEIFPAFREQMVVEQKAHLGRINRELKKIKRSEYKLAESILASIERVHAVLKAKPGSEAALANYFSFTADLGQRSLKHMEPALRGRFSMLLMKFSIRWVAFICDDCVPSDSRTFKWAVSALEFAMTMTRNENILRLSDEEFASLRAKVASCMTLLISHFDILGARSSFQAKQEKERMDVAREEVRKQLRETLNFLNNVEHLRTFGDHRNGHTIADTGLAYDGQMSLEARAKVRERWLNEIQGIEARRLELESSMRVVGRVLDEERPEDKSLLFLATSNSNISIRWQQGKFIGGGTFGSVYLAVNLDSGALMAVKEIKFADLSSAPNLIKQVRDEMQVMEMLSHPNIVEYYGIEVHRDKVYIFEEYCQGGSLANLLEHGRIEDESVIQIYTVQMLDGLMYLHSMNVVHRDIKPDNILLDHLGVIKFVDFGAAKVLAKNQKTMAAKTRAPGPNGDVNSLTGTPMYMSPEVIKGDHRGRRGAMDIWSLGCVVLECATGRRPWSNLDNEWAIMFHIGIATKHPPLPEKHELSELGIDFIESCLCIDPLKRPTAAELMEHPWIQQFSAAIAHEMRLAEERDVAPINEAEEEDTVEQAEEAQERAAYREGGGDQDDEDEAQERHYDSRLPLAAAAHHHHEEAAAAAGQ